MGSRQLSPASTSGAGGIFGVGSTHCDNADQDDMTLSPLDPKRNRRRPQHGDVLSTEWVHRRQTFEEVSEARLAVLEARLAQLERLV